MKNIEVFLSLAKRLAIKIAHGKWRCIGTLYGDLHLEAATASGVSQNDAIVSLALRLTNDFVTCYQCGVLFTEDLEVAERKAEVFGWVDGHAYIERLVHGRAKKATDELTRSLTQLSHATDDDG